MLKEIGVAETYIDEKNILGIRIDFNKVNSINAVKKEVEFIIDTFILQKKIQLKTKKYQDNFDEILLIGRLKASNPKLTWSEIGKQVFKSNFLSLESDIKRVQQHFKKYLQLINGGWRSFEFP